MEKTQIFRDGPSRNENIKGNEKNRLKKLTKPISVRFEKSAFFPFLEEIFTSNGFRIVKNEFQHTLRVSGTLSQHQGIRR